MPPGRFKGVTRGAYCAAGEIPKTIAQLPCYCHCDDGFGHKSLHSRFVADHASHCAVCVEESPAASTTEAESGVAIDFKLLRSLRSPLTRRLFELVNLLAGEGKRDFDFALNELAHEHLGLSQKITAPSQVWGKIEPSFAKLAERGILESYELVKPALRVTGRVGSKYVPQRLLPLPPLPSEAGVREALKERLLALGTYKNQVNPLVDECPNDLLDKAGYILDYVEQDRRDNTARPKPKAATYSWGGWAARELRHLIEHGEVNPRIASIAVTGKEDGPQQALPL